MLLAGHSNSSAKTRNQSVILGVSPASTAFGSKIFLSLSLSMTYMSPRLTCNAYSAPQYNKSVRYRDPNEQR